MKSLLLMASLLAAPAHAAAQWVVVHSLAPDIAGDEKLADDIMQLSRGRVLSIGVALVADETVEESRTALGLTEVSSDKLPTLIAGVEAKNGVLVAVQPAEDKLEVSVYRHDLETEVTTVVRKVVGKGALKRTLKKNITDAIKTPKARKKKKKKKGEAVEEAIDESFRKVGLTIANLDADGARDLGLKKPSGAYVTAVAKGKVAARYLEVGDVILKVDKKKVKGPGEISGWLLQAELGDIFPFEVWRNGAKTRVDMHLGPEPEPEQPAEEETTTEPVATTTPAEPEEPPPPPRSLGVRVGVVTPELAESLGLLAPTGALIKIVKVNTAAERAKLKANDVILTVNEKPVTHARNLNAMVKETYPRQRVNIEVWRDRKKVVLPVAFEDAKSAAAAKKAPVKKAP